MTASSDGSDGVPGDVRERIRQAILRLEARGSTASVRAVRAEAEAGSKHVETTLRRWRAGELDLSKPWGEPEAEPVAGRDAKAENPLVAAGEARRAAAAAELAEDPVLAALEALGTTTDPLIMIRAGTVLAARRVASAYKTGDALREMDGFKKQIEELRRCEQSYLEIGKEKGFLIEREVAKAVLGELAQRAIRVLENYRARLGAQVEAWVSDEAFKKLSSEERARAVWAWADAATFKVRATDADEVEKLIAAEVADRAKES